MIVLTCVWDVRICLFTMCLFKFQVVDMRWGVREEAIVDHSSEELCLKEIRACDEVSLGPTFVVSF